MPRIAGHRMRFYRRNFKRMYPEAGERAVAQLRSEMRRRRFVQYTAAAAAVAAAAAAWWWLVIR